VTAQELRARAQRRSELLAEIEQLRRVRTNVAPQRARRVRRQRLQRMARLLG
jgi:hypothetical protein